MRIKVIQDLSNVDDDAQFRRYASQSVAGIISVVNGQLTFDDNINTSTVAADFTAANTEIKIGHGLGRAPTGWIVSMPTVAMQVYKGDTDDTDTNIYVKSSAIGKCGILVF